MEAYKLVASTEGVFVEPACAPWLELIQSVKAGRIPAGSVVTATMTGHGLKDLTSHRCAAQKPDVCEPHLEDVSA